MEALLIVVPVLAYLSLLLHADRSQARYYAECNAKAEADAIEREKARKDAAKTVSPSVATRKRGRPRKVAASSEPAPVKRIAPTVPMAEEKPAAAPIPCADPVRFAPVGNNAFAGQTVAFTGRIPGMTRQEAIAAVQRNGGRAFDSMPSGTTILVVGDKPGAGKLKKAEDWIGSCRKITPRDFSIMLEQPFISMELNQAASYIAGLLNDHNTCKEA